MIINRRGKQVTRGASEAKSDPSESALNEEPIVTLWATREDGYDKAAASQLSPVYSSG